MKEWKQRSFGGVGVTVPSPGGQAGYTNKVSDHEHRPGFFRGGLLQAVTVWLRPGAADSRALTPFGVKRVQGDGQQPTGLNNITDDLEGLLTMSRSARKKVKLYYTMESLILAQDER